MHIYPSQNVPPDLRTLLSSPALASDYTHTHLWTVRWVSRPLITNKFRQNSRIFPTIWEWRPERLIRLGLIWGAWAIRDYMENNISTPFLSSSHGTDFISPPPPPTPTHTPAVPLGGRQQQNLLKLLISAGTHNTTKWREVEIWAGRQVEDAFLDGIQRAWSGFASQHVVLKYRLGMKPLICSCFQESPFGLGCIWLRARLL